MRMVVLLTLMSTIVYGCAYPAEHQAAIYRCQAVGITQDDPQFATCAKAFVQASREQRLEDAYHGARNVVPYEEHTRHNDVQVY